MYRLITHCGCKPENLVHFLDFIDQYPTDILSIDALEMDLIKYLDKHEIKCVAYIKNVSTKYQLKHLYVWVHNQKYK